MAITISSKHPKNSAGQLVQLAADEGDWTTRDKATYAWTVTAFAATASTTVDKAWVQQLAQQLLATPDQPDCKWATLGLEAGTYTVKVERTLDGAAENTSMDVEIKAPGGGADAGDVAQYEAASSGERSLQAIADSLESGLKIRRTEDSTDDQALWVKIRDCTGRRRFNSYAEFIDAALCKRRPASSGDRPQRVATRAQPALPASSYGELRAATDLFLLGSGCCGDAAISSAIDLEAEATRLGRATTVEELTQMLSQLLAASGRAGSVPYVRRIVDNLWGTSTPSATGFPFCSGSARLDTCLFELIWSYWQEEGMLVQTLNAIAARFQNRRVVINGNAALANLDVSVLRPLNPLLWGYLSEHNQRLSVRRRAYEYDHAYGLRLVGSAVGELDSADSRSRFVESFHVLLHQCADFFRENSNQMVVPDTYPLLTAIRNTHLTLAEGFSNQFGDLPSTARAEMLVEQWLLAQEPIRGLLRTREGTPYSEPWMGPVDAMKQLVGWGDASVIYFHDLATFGEQLLLSLRYGDWANPSASAPQARNWALYWKNEIQGYMEAYRVATGVDLSGARTRIGPIDSTPPSRLLAERRARRSA